MLIALLADISAQDHILEKSKQMLIRMMFDVTAVCAVPGLSGKKTLPTNITTTKLQSTQIAITKMESH